MEMNDKLVEARNHKPKLSKPNSRLLQDPEWRKRRPAVPYVAAWQRGLTRRSGVVAYVLRTGMRDENRYHGKSKVTIVVMSILSVISKCKR